MKNLNVNVPFENEASHSIENVPYANKVHFLRFEKIKPSSSPPGEKSHPDWWWRVVLGFFGIFSVRNGIELERHVGPNSRPERFERREQQNRF